MHAIKRQADMVVKATVFAGKLALTGICFWLILRSVNGADLIARLGQLPLLDVALLAAGMTALGLLQAMRWRGILSVYVRPPSRMLLIRSTLLSLFSMQLLPGTIGADAIRIGAVVNAGVGIRHAFFSCLIDRAAALAVLSLFSLLAVPTLLRGMNDRWIVIAILGISAAGAASLATALFTNILDRFVKHASTLGRIARIRRDLMTFLFSRQAVIAVFSYSVLIHLYAVVAYAVLFRYLASSVGLLDCLILVPPVLLVSFLPISINGWGVREAALLGIFAHTGTPSANVLAVGVSFGMLALISGVLCGIVWLILEATQWKKEVL